MSTLVVGVLVAMLFTWSLKRTRKDLKNSKCGGCSGCGLKNQCHSVQETPIQLRL
ncbi:FeoB-associated Cys-rich membrane protein [Fusibacter sp. 3D3]|uniref:FeoB-associated Cys-rich membrane protein n=1 Tax=Fusibacter sp. 3D3 TaxID=1048380 RepID=UPI0009FF4F83|nr:FeoB-associated Cys-rich membrane protein [Fusibacter sp. 3D3]